MNECPGLAYEHIVILVLIFWKKWSLLKLSPLVKLFSPNLALKLLLPNQKTFRVADR